MHTQVSTSDWCTIWGNAISITNHTPEQYSRNITLRYPVFVPFSGDMLRLTFDNFCGTEEIQITQVSVAKCLPNQKPLCHQIDPDTLVSVTFSGAANASIPAGGRLKTDPIPFTVSQGDILAVSFYLGDYTLMRSSVITTGPLSGGQYAVGNHCHTTVFPLNDTRNTNCCYFLSDVELLCPSDCHAVVCYGDSITAQDWPEYLTLLFAKRPNNKTAVVRKAASGTRILRQYECITYESYGLKGDIRFPHELPVTGADTIIIQQGINDIIHPVGLDVNVFRPMSDLPSLDELTAGYSYYINEAKKQQLTIFTGTLLPIFGWRTYAPFREDLKNQFNDWLRTCPLSDGCIDFEAAVCDPEQKKAFLPAYDSGDHLHPSKAAYQKMAELAFSYLKNT